MIPAAEIEAVARAACKEMGLDADTLRFGDPNDNGLVWMEYPEWEFHRRAARQAIAFHRAIEAVKGEGK